MSHVFYLGLCLWVLSFVGMEVSRAQETGICATEADPYPDILEIQKNPEKIKELLGIPSTHKLSKECFPLEKLNFGVMVHNDFFSIYRSSALGDRGYTEVKKHLQKNGLPLPKSVIYMNQDGYTGGGALGYFMGFINPDQMENSDFAFTEDKRFSKEGIKFFHPLAKEDSDANTYLGGKNPIISPDDPVHVNDILGPEARDFYQAKGIDFQNRILKGDRETLYQLLDMVLRKGDGKVLFHCKGGRHRTGMIAMSIRHLQGGLWTQEFKRPLKIRAFTKHLFPKEVSLRNLAEYEYYLHNPNQFRIENLEAIRQFSQEERFGDLKKEFQARLNQGSLCEATH